jgi:hypothetical protein
VRRHDEGPGDLSRGLDPVVSSDDVQAQVDAGRETGAGEDVPVVYVQDGERNEPSFGDMPREDIRRRSQKASTASQGGPSRATVSAARRR